MESNDIILISSNWDINITGKTIQDTLKIYRNQFKFRLCNTNLLEYDTCINLVKPDTNCNSTTDSRISLNVNPNLSSDRIKEMLIVCGISKLEIFGEGGIYLETKYGEKIDDILELPVYFFEIQFPCPVKECSFKLLLYEESTFWIYGIHVLLMEDSRVTVVGNINYDHVEQLLKDTKVSDSAKKCLDYVKHQNKTSLSTMIPSSVNNNNNNVELLKNYTNKQFQDMKDYLRDYEKKMSADMNSMCNKIADMLRDHEQKINRNLNLIRDEILSSCCNTLKMADHNGTL